MEDETTFIPIPKSGIEYVNQAAEVHSITVIVSALAEASALVSNSTQLTSEKERQSALREAEECAGVAMTYLAALIKTPAGRRVHWMAGYTPHYGTIVQTMDNGQYMVVPDETPAAFMYPHECEIIQ
jgi:hypothetical protein